VRGAANIIFNNLKKSVQSQADFANPCIMDTSIRRSLTYSIYLVISILTAMGLQFLINVILVSLKQGYWIIYLTYLIFSLVITPKTDRRILSKKIVFLLIIGPAIALCIFGLIVNHYLFPLKFPIETILTLLACLTSYLIIKNKKYGVAACLMTLVLIFIFNSSFHGKIAFDRYTRISPTNNEGLTYSSYFYTLDKKQISAELLKSKKVVLLNFEFVACTPCLRKKPFFEKLYQHYKNSNSVLIASICYGKYSSFDEWKEYYTVKNKDKYNFPVFYDSTCRFSNFLLVRKTFPQEVIITQNGGVIEGPASFMSDIGDYYLEQNINKIDSILKSGKINE
jgi:hypothetical protein